MNGAYGEGMRAFDRLFEFAPWLGAAVGILVLIWIARSWRNA